MKPLMRQGAVLVLLFTAICVFSTRSQAQDSDGMRKVLIKTQPQYPTIARSMNIHGTVKLEAVVAPNGTVKTVDVKGGHPILTQSAVSAVGHWKFEPAPKETREPIEIKFEQE